MRIAVVDDDPLQLEFFQQALPALGHACHPFDHGAALLKALRRDTFDLLIVDWELPDTSGPEIIRWVRGQLGPQLPILFVTHRQDESDLVAGLACGADDFMGKPVRVAELGARLGALLRRAYGEARDAGAGADKLSFGRYCFRQRSRELLVDGEPVALKAREYDLALLLFQNADRLLSRDHLRERLWGQGPQVQSRSLDTHISRLRTLLDLRPANGYAIRPVYGLGYRLECTSAGAGARE